MSEAEDDAIESEQEASSREPTDSTEQRSRAEARCTVLGVVGFSADPAQIDVRQFLEVTLDPVAVECILYSPALLRVESEKS